MGTAVHRALAETEFYKQAAGYGMESAVVNGMDVLTTYKAFSDYLPRAREGRPFLLEVRTYRYRGHSMSDPAQYRTKEELEQKKNEDPIIRLKSYLVQNELFTNEELDPIDRKSTRLNSSHVAISYAVFCLKKKNKCSHTAR